MSADFDRLSVEDVTRHYGRRRALSRVTFQLEAGEILGLLGPNGAGKSTLLAILSTVLTPSAGTVRYGDCLLRDAGSELRARIGFLAHDLYLYPELTARENLQFFSRLYGLPAAGRHIEAALERANLLSRAEETVSGYSRGMRQRLALERALLHGPRLLLLDEPFTGLDDASTAALVARLRGLGHEGCLVILTTHDLEVAEGLIDRAVVLRDGRVAAVDQTHGSLRERYRAHLAETSG